MKAKEKVPAEKRIDCDMLLDNAPIDSDDYAIEAQVLNAQIQKKGVNNIAVVAPYGAGKSSAITTYIKRYRKTGIGKPKHVQISLADFNQDEGQTQIEYQENAIERSILQQLLYSQRKHKLPNSTLNRTNKTRITALLWYSFWAIAFLFATIALIFETSGNSLFGNWKYISPILTVLAVISVVFLIISLLYTGKLRKIKYKDLEVSLDKDGKPQGDVSLINRFIDEVLYFFECIKVDLVIFEDLDRFENLKIFVKLRELNTIINNSPIKAKKVTFVYAVKDTMFKDENQRAKFFEFILPVIPIINPITTADQIRLKNDNLTKSDSTLRLSEQFIKDISYFIDDMRVLKNAFNDYIIMARKLSENTENQLNKKRENLFAIALYKNLYPYDYARLQKNEGLVPLCIDKRRLVDSFITTRKDDIKKLEAEKERIKKEVLNDFEELKLLFKGQHLIYAYSNVRGAKQVEEIDTFCDVDVLRHPNGSGYTVQVQKLPSGESYYERELVIKNKATNRIAQIEKEIRSIKLEIESEENELFYNLLNRIGIDEYFSKDNIRAIFNKYREQIANERFMGVSSDQLPNTEDDPEFISQFSLIRMFIHKNYIDEDYLEYISNYCSEISDKDRKFIRNVKQGYMQTFTYKLDDITSVIKNLSDEDFAQSAILIKDILSSLTLIKNLDTSDSVKTNKFSVLMSLLASGKKSVIVAVKEYLTLIDRVEEEHIADIIAQYAAPLIQYLFEDDISDSHKDIFVNALVKHKQFSILYSKQIKSYIAECPYYLKLFKGLSVDAVNEFIEKVCVIFAKIDLSNGRDRIFDFIVHGNYYQLNIHNIRVVLNIYDENNPEFEQKNYTFIKNCGIEIVQDRVNNNINEYIEQIFLKLPQSTEDEAAIKELLANENIVLENRIKIIEHADFKMRDFDSVDTQLYSAIIKNNRIEANWQNIVSAYKVLDLGAEITEFISLNEGNISGLYPSLEPALQIELFNKLISLPLKESDFNNLAKCIDIKLKMNATYGSCANIKPFILVGIFEFNIADMRFLLNQPGMFPYWVYYQEKILASMKEFFGNLQFESGAVKSIIEEKSLSVDFKKKLLELYGDTIQLHDTEILVARFIVDNQCTISESLLYKFTGVAMEASLKLSLLALAIKQSKISNLSQYRLYFSSIGDAYAKLINEGEKMTIENNITNRLIAEFMKEKGMCSYNSKKDKIYLKSA